MTSLFSRPASPGRRNKEAQVFLSPADDPPMGRVPHVLNAKSIGFVRRFSSLDASFDKFRQTVSILIQPNKPSAMPLFSHLAYDEAYATWRKQNSHDAGKDRSAEAGDVTA